MVKITCIKWPKIREKRNEIIRLFEQKNNRLSTFIKIHKKFFRQFDHVPTNFIFQVLRCHKIGPTRAVVVAQLTEQLPLNPEDEGSSPGNFILIMRLQIYC